MINLIEKYFPFYQYAVISNRTLCKFDLNDTRLLYDTEIKVTKLDSQVLQGIIDSVSKTEVDIIHFLPNDVYFISDTNGQDVYDLLYADCENKQVNAVIHNIDYLPIARRINVLDDHKVAYNLGRNYCNISEVVTTKYILDALIDVKTAITSDELKSKKLTEAFGSEDDDIPDDILKSAPSITIDDNYANNLEDYLRSSQPKSMVPLLLGLSGIAKSAIVKSVVDKLDAEYTSGQVEADYAVDEGVMYADTEVELDSIDTDGKRVKVKYVISYADARKYGMRLVDIRCGLMHRLDIDGMYEIQNSNIGDTVSYSAPPIEFVQCTDAYVLFARKMLAELQNKKKSSKIKGEKREQLDKAIEYFKYASKIPVLFFDEINRSKANVRNTLVTLLSSGMFGTMSMKLCKIVAAANMPIGNLVDVPSDIRKIRASSGNIRKGEVTYKSDLELAGDSVFDFFVGTGLVDSNAFSSRFKMVNISPEDAFPVWRKWAQQVNEYGNSNIHPSVLSYVVNHQRAYDVDTIYKYCNSEEEEYKKARDLGYIPAYPTYRAWQFVSNYLYHVENSRSTINPSIIEGLLGKQASDAFVDHLNRVNSDFTRPKPYKKSDSKKRTLPKLAGSVLNSRRKLLLQALSSCMSPLVENKTIQPDGYNSIEVSKIDQDILNAPDSSVDLASISPVLKLADERIKEIEAIIKSNDFDVLDDYSSERSDNNFDFYIKLVNGLATQHFDTIQDTQQLYVTILNKLNKLNSSPDSDTTGFIVRKLINTAVANPDIFDFDKSAIDSGEIKPVKDSLTEFVHDSLNANIPVALIGVSGIGKSTRVEDYCKEHDYIYHPIMLAGKQSSDALGIPTPVDLVAQISKENTGILNTVGLTESVIQSYLNDFGLRPKTTVKAPNDDLHSVIKTSEETGKHVVLFFDEANRTADLTIQSAIFQGVSDRKLFGVSFDPEKVHIVVAGNTLADSSSYGSLKKYDPALLARCTVAVKDSYSLSDIDAVWSYMSDKSKNYNGYHPLLIKWFESLGVYRTEVLKQCLESIERSALCNNCSSTRALKELKNALAGNYSQGVMLFTDNERRPFTQANLSPINMVEKLKKIVGQFDKWSANLGKFAIDSLSSDKRQHEGKSYENLAVVIRSLRKRHEKLISNVKNTEGAEKGLTDLEFLQKVYDSKSFAKYPELSKYYRKTIELMNIILRVDQAVSKIRRSKIAEVLGQGDTFYGTQERSVRFDIVNTFGKFFDENSGRIEAQAMTIDDIIDIDTAKSYMLQWFDNYAKNDSRILWSDELYKIRKVKEDSISSLVYLAAIDQAVESNAASRQGNISSNQEQMLNIAESELLKPVILDLENNDTNEKQLVNFLSTRFGKDPDDYYRVKESLNAALAISPMYIDNINRDLGI